MAACIVNAVNTPQRQPPCLARNVALGYGAVLSSYLSRCGKRDGLAHHIDRHLVSKPTCAAAFEQFMRFADAGQRKHRAYHRLDQAAFNEVCQRAELASFRRVNTK